MNWLSVSARLLLFAVFAVAAAGKAKDREGTASALRGFKVPDRLIPPLRIALPVAEGAVAIGMVFSGSAQWAGVGAIFLLMLFVVGIATAMRRGEAPDCHCFGQIHSEPAGPRALVRNGLLLAVAGVVVLDSSPPGLVAWLGERSIGELCLAFAATGLICGGVVAALRAIENHPHRKKLAVGMRPPALSAVDATGSEVTIDRLATWGSPCVLTFLSPQCGPCVELLPQIARWQRTLEGRLPVHVISSGSEEEQRAIVERHGLTNIWRESDQEISRAFGVPGTPAAVVIGADGAVATETTAGLAAIEALVRIALRL